MFRCYLAGDYYGYTPRTAPLLLLYELYTPLQA